MYALPTKGDTTREDAIRLADWIELNVLTDEERSVSVDELTDAIAEEPPDDSSISEHRQDYALGAEQELDADNQPEGFWQRAETVAQDAFSQMWQRSRWFRSRYPFAVDRDTVTANPRFDSIELAKFLTLLRSRHLYYAALEDDGTVAGELFEELLPFVLRRYLDTGAANAFRFGVAGGSRGSGLPDDANDALHELSKRIGEPRGGLPNLRKDGDYAADAIAWKPLGDPLPGKLVAVGQATISEKAWTDKQPSPKWKSRSLIGFLAPPTTVVAFVETISLTSPAVLNGLGEQFASVPLDRFRLLHVLRDHDVPSELRTKIVDWCGGMRDRLRR